MKRIEFRIKESVKVNYHGRRKEEERIFLGD